MKELRDKYSEVYAWVKAQPCVSYDFVQVPIESLAELLHIDSDRESDNKQPKES